MNGPVVPWSRVIAEGVAIVVSILLAFGIQAGWETRQQRAEERRALALLDLEFRANRDSLRVLMTDHAANLEGLRRFYETPLEELRGMDADSIVDAVVGAFILQITYDPSIGAMETLLRGGRISVLRDLELENMLWLWQRQLVDSQEEGRLLIETVNGSLEEFVRLGVMNPHMPDELAPNSVERMWRSEFLGAQAVTLDLWRRVYLDELQSLYDLTDAVIALIAHSSRAAGGLR